jgi:hypothetical protein
VVEVDSAFDTQRLSIGRVHPEKLYQIGNAPLLPSFGHVTMFVMTLQAKQKLEKPSTISKTPALRYQP